MKVEFLDDTGDRQYLYVDFLPRVGDAVVLDYAPKGVRHIVVGVEHKIGGGTETHRIRIDLKRTSDPAV